MVTNIDQSYSEDDVCKIFKDSSGVLQTKVQYNGGQMFGLVDFKVSYIGSTVTPHYHTGWLFEKDKDMWFCMYLHALAHRECLV